MTPLKDIEANLAQTRADLALVSARVVAIQVSLEKCERDDFPRLPPLPMYKRPKFLPTDC